MTLLELLTAKMRNIYKKRKLTAHYYYDHHQEVVQIYHYQFVIFLCKPISFFIMKS
jgi:hypothetical protein